MAFSSPVKTGSSMGHPARLVRRPLVGEASAVASDALAVEPRERRRRGEAVKAAIVEEDVDAHAGSGATAVAVAAEIDTGAARGRRKGPAGSRRRGPKSRTNSTPYSVFRYATSALLSSAVRSFVLPWRLPLFTRTRSSRVAAEPSWRYGALAKMPRSEGVLTSVGARSRRDTNGGAVELDVDLREVRLEVVELVVGEDTRRCGRRRSSPCPRRAPCRRPARR